MWAPAPPCPALAQCGPCQWPQWCLHYILGQCTSIILILFPLWSAAWGRACGHVGAAVVTGRRGDMDWRDGGLWVTERRGEAPGPLGPVTSPDLRRPIGPRHRDVTDTSRLAGRSVIGRRVSVPARAAPLLHSGVHSGAAPAGARASARPPHARPHAAPATPPTPADMHGLTCSGPVKGTNSDFRDEEQPVQCC